MSVDVSSFLSLVLNSLNLKDGNQPLRFNLKVEVLIKNGKVLLKIEPEG